MKKTILSIVIACSLFPAFSQEPVKDFACLEYPNNDAVLDEAIIIIAESALQYKKLFTEFLNGLDRPQQEALGNAVNNNDPSILQQYPYLANGPVLDLFTRMIQQYQIAWARQKELFPHADSAANFENLGKSIVCCIEKLSINSNNILAKADDDCYRAFEKCNRNVDRAYGWCMFWSGLGGLGSAFVATPAAGVMTFAAGMTKCAFNAAMDTKECKDEYDACIKKQQQ